MSADLQKKTFIGSIGGHLLLLFGKKPKPSAKDFQKLDFKTSTQKMGVRFTDKIRNIFRFKWLKKT